MKMRRSSSTGKRATRCHLTSACSVMPCAAICTLFGSEAGVEAAWVVVNDVLSTAQPLHVYEPGSWGPSEAAGLAASAGGWVECSAQ